MRIGDFEITTRIGLGTNRLTNSRANLNFIKAAMASGVSMIDTAHSYTGGESEETIGEALSPRSDAGIVATKGGIGGPGRGKPEALQEEIEESLSAIKAYRDRGQIRHVGISEVVVDEIERARKVVPIAAVQNHYNLAERRYEAVVDYCEAEGIPFVPFFPLRAGGGKALDAIAKKHGATPAQVTLAWLLQRSPVMLPIPGTLSLEHLKENLAAARIELTDEEFKQLR